MSEHNRTSSIGRIRRQRNRASQRDDGYVPSSPTASQEDSVDYVTSPPKRGPGSIATLFRRGASPTGSSGKSAALLEQESRSSSRQSSRQQSQQYRMEERGGERRSRGSRRTSRRDGNLRRSSSAGSQGSRVFYSSNNDRDSDSDDSFESRAATATSAASSTVVTHEESTINDYDTYDDSRRTNNMQTIVRFRGFSTSIKNLFLDESLVCASMGCFGLILSNRTEHLLQLRNDRRGVKWGRSRTRRALPSRLVAYALLITLILMGTTFVIWGFGNGNNGGNNSLADVFMDGYDYDNDDRSNNNNNNNNNNAYYNNDDNVNNAAQNDDAVNNANANDDGNDDAVAQNNNNGNDDAVNNANANDDAVNNNNNQGGDDYYAADDDDNNNNNNNAVADDDDAAAAAQGDDAVNNNNNNDDGVAENGDDAVADDNDDAAAAAVDDYYRADDDGARRLVTSTKTTRAYHRAHGICKMRDMNEAIWLPAMDYLRDEWQSSDHQHLRSLEDNMEYDEEESQISRDLASDLRISFLFAFLVVLGILGRRRRMRTRYYLVRARAQEDHLFYASSAAGAKRVAFQDTREDQYEGACSHTLCGCYPVDPPMDGDELDDEVQVGDDGVQQRKKQRHHDDCLSRAFNVLLSICCGAVCKCWFQCLSVCALAQEAREMRLLIPTRYQRIDFITHQPFHEYQKSVNDLRRGWMGKSRSKAGIVPHIKALSRLSRYILAVFGVVFLVIVVTLLFNPRAAFSWPDAIVLIATFSQSFLVLYLVHWIFHKSDLSLDAVIKFFAAGFVIAVPSAFFFEGILVNFTLSSAWMMYSVGEWISGEAFEIWVIQHWRILWIIGELVNAYIVAAVTEELCKYYTFRCVEHPDLVFLTGLDKESQGAKGVRGGMVKYPFGSHQIQRGNSESDSGSVSSQGSHRSKRSERSDDGSTLKGADDDEFLEDENDVRTHRQRAMAVTTGMISVAVGLACAENFLYVFLLGGAGTNAASGSDVIEEWIVLFFRSIFPVHALAAAMQSVSMIRKFIECKDDNNHRVGVGRIILPAVIMHGSFDAVLLGINVYIESAWDNLRSENDGNIEGLEAPYNALIVNAVAWTSIIGIMLIGLIWYYRQNRSQRLRLIAMEEHDEAINGSQYTSPPETSTSREDNSTVADSEIV